VIIIIRLSIIANIFDGSNQKKNNFYWVILLKMSH